MTRVSLEVGTEGILGGQAVVADVEGTWKVTRGVGFCTVAVETHLHCAVPSLDPY